jgi:hypothetical protein
MAVDKGLYQAPKGIESLAQDEEPIEIEIVDPEEVHITAGDLEIDIEPAEDSEFGNNLAEDLDEGALTKLASELSSDIENDRNSRKDWEKTYTEGLKLLGLNYEERTEPWNGASGVFHPMITEAVVRFQSETITEMFPAAGPVRTKIIGKETPEKMQAAQRVEADMNYELTEVMREFRPEQERMLWSLPATGSAFKKVYFDPSLNRQVSMFIPAEDIILPYGTTDLDTCYRITHVMRKTKNEIIKLQKAGFYRDCDLEEPTKQSTDIQKAKDKETGFTDINDDRYTLYEVHVDLDIDGYNDEEDGEETGIALPYVMTMVKGSNQVLAIRRNWLEEDELKLKRQHFVHYQYIPGFGAYGFGLFHLIGGFAKSATSIMRQLVDAGTLSNLPGGLKSRGLRIKGDDTPIAPGEFRDVDIGSGALRDNILPLPYKEPSQVLYTLLGNIVEEGRRFASTADMNVSDMSAQAPVGTTLALLERQLKVMSAVQARLHHSFKQELRLLAGIIRDYTETNYEYEPDGNADEAPAQGAKKADYDHVDVIPVSDPNAATMAQKIVQYQAVLQLAQTAPQIYNMPLLHRQMIDVLGVKNANKLVPTEDDEIPTDPIQENQDLLTGKPVKAFMEQDHKAHIQVHQLAMQDPKIMQLVGQNPRAQMIQAAMMAHLNEHIGFEYRRQIQEKMGLALPTEEQNKKVSPELANQIAQIAAQAAQELFQQNSAEAKQMAAQQQMQDPVVQMQQQELQIRMEDLKLKAQKQQIDAAQKADQIRVEESRIEAQKEIAAMQVAAQSAAKRDQLDKQQQIEGTRMGLEIAKNRFQAMQNRNKPSKEKN